MAEIILTQGQTTQIDDADLELTQKHKWCAQRVDSGSYYASTSISGKGGKRQKIYLHRLLMNPPEDLVVDHKDGNPLNNRRSNLRVCTHSQNIVASPRGKEHKATSTYRGVRYVAKGKRKWQAGIYRQGSYRHLGVFDTELEAATARDKAAFEMWGEFAVLNIPREAEEQN